MWGFIIEKNKYKKMKKFFLVLLCCGCSNVHNDYDKIVDGLSNNHVLLKKDIDDELYYDYFKVEKNQYELVLQEYEKAINDFYNSDKLILDYLIKFKDVDDTYCDWIIITNPYSAKVKDTDLLTKSKGSLILIDNYLTNINQKTIKSELHSENVDYERFIAFYKKNRELKKEELKAAYVKNFNINASNVPSGSAP